jgi:hypothetical protein
MSWPHKFFFFKFGLIRQGAFGVLILFSFQFFSCLAAVFAEEVSAVFL